MYLVCPNYEILNITFSIFSSQNKKFRKKYFYMYGLHILICTFKYLNFKM